jgi:hypothetical protein
MARGERTENHPGRYGGRDRFEANYPTKSSMSLNTYRRNETAASRSVTDSKIGATARPYASTPERRKANIASGLTARAQERSVNEREDELHGPEGALPEHVVRKQRNRMLNLYPLG